MNEEEVKRVERILTKGGFDVVRNSLPVPEGIQSPTIVYAPGHRDLSKVEDLRELFARNDFYLELEPAFRSNHFYTAENVGVYLNPHQAGTRRALPIVGAELFGECPEVDATLSLHGNLTFAAEFIGWDEQTQSETTNRTQGTWRQQAQSIVLSTKEVDVTFRITRFSETTDYAKIDVLKLSGSEDYQDFEDCDFSYREMDPW